jgi:anti-sigma regulatory factor (Ser/Thr protein kinase)
VNPSALEIQLIVPSRIESLSVINAVAEEVTNQLDMDEQARNAITISVVEAGTNAIEHGNRYDSTKPTEVVFRQENGALIILVRDQGAGFDVDKRGVHILRAFMDEVDFEFKAGRGTECRLVKYLPQKSHRTDE